MILRKRDLQGEPCWQLRQYCPCGEVVQYTITLPLGLAEHARLKWRSMAARRLMHARREIREHIARDQRRPAR
jgi:hypothetical protein